MCLKIQVSYDRFQFPNSSADSQILVCKCCVTVRIILIAKQTVWRLEMSSYLQPLVNTLGVEFVSTRQHTHQLMCIKVIHADNTESLCITLGLCTEAVWQQLINVALRQAMRRVSKTLGKIQQSLSTSSHNLQTSSHLKCQRSCIAVNETPPHSYGVSLAIWDPTVLPWTRHKWTLPPSPSQTGWYSIYLLQWDGRLSWPRWSSK